MYEIPIIRISSVDVIFIFPEAKSSKSAIKIVIDSRAVRFAIVSQEKRSLINAVNKAFFRHLVLCPCQRQGSIKKICQIKKAI